MRVKGRPAAWMRSFVLGSAMALSMGAPCRVLLAQDSTTARPRPVPQSTWRPRYEGSVLLGTLMSAAAISAFDDVVGREMREADFRDNTAVGRTAHFARGVGQPGAILFSAGLWGIGAVTRRPGLSDAGFHATESIVLAGTVTTALKFTVGRARPRDVEGSDGDEFAMFRGNKDAWSSMPSGHTTVAFAAASALSAELGRTRPKTARWVRPILYATAAAVGISRVVDERHWASDVLVGAGVGTIVGRRLVAFSHRARTPR